MIEIGKMNDSAILHFSKANDGDERFAINGVNCNFTVKEFACKDGSDLITVSVDLVKKLQKMRDIVGLPITINSGYRTPDYNKKVGGAAQSQHIYGRAADIVVGGMTNIATALEVAILAQYIGFNGIGLYGTFTHVDTRAVKSYWDNTKQGALKGGRFGWV